MLVLDPIPCPDGPKDLVAGPFAPHHLLHTYQFLGALHLRGLGLGHDHRGLTGLPVFTLLDPDAK